MSLDRNPDPDPFDREYDRAQERLRKEENAALEREAREAYEEFELEGYELSESDDLERFAARRQFLEGQDRQRAWLIRKKGQ